MALALYRKYRPASFAEVVGQDHVTGPLSQALSSGRVSHAYLFSGPRGCGKTSSARILARSLNCEAGPTPTPCGTCDSCTALAPNGAGTLDVVEIDAASHGGVDDARDLRERAFYAPVSSRYKIYIVDEAHMVSAAGFNALLKLVEEPPDFLKFVFATTEPEKVIGTIRSRTHHYPFRLVPADVLRGLLERVCRDEGIDVEPSVFPLVVRAGAGSVRDSLSVLDQVLAGAGPAGVTYDAVVGLLGYTPASLLDDVVEAIGAADGGAVFGAVDRVVSAGLDPRRFCEDLLQHVRDLLVLSAVPDAGRTGLLDCPSDQLQRMSEQVLHFGPAALSRTADLLHAGLAEMRGTTSPRLLLELVLARVLLPGAAQDVTALTTRLERLERRMAIGGDVPAGPPPPVGPVAAASPASRVQVEVTPQAGYAPSPADRSATAAAGPVTTPAAATPAAPTPAAATPAAATPAAAAPAAATPAAAPAPAAASSTAAEPVAPAGARSPAAAPEAPLPAPPARAPEAPHAAVAASAPAAAVVPPSATGPVAPSGALDATAVRRLWPQVLDAVKARKRTPHALLQSATVLTLDGRVLTLGFSTPALARQLQSGTNTEVLQEALEEVLGASWEVRGVAGQGDPLPAGSAPASAGSGPVAWGAAARPSPSPVAPSPGGSTPVASSPGASAPDATSSGASAPGASASGASASGSSALAPSSPQTSGAGSAGQDGRGPRTAPSSGGAATAAPQGRAAAAVAAARAHAAAPTAPPVDPRDEVSDDDAELEADGLSSEERAMQLLQRDLGATVIGRIGDT